MPRTKQNFDHKKEEIIKIALELFMEKSYEHTTIKDIIKASNLSKGGMYHYFDSKEDILNASLEYIAEQDYERFNNIINSQVMTAIEKLQKVILLGCEKPENVQKVVNYSKKEINSIFVLRMRKLGLEKTVSCLEKIIEQGIKEKNFHTEYPKEMAEFCCYAGQFLYDSIIPEITKDEYNKKLSAYLCLIEKCLGLEKGILDDMKESLMSQLKN